MSGAGTAASTWLCNGSVWVGNAGNGTLEIRNGGVVTSAGNGFVGFAVNSTGSAIVNGLGSTWTTAQNLFVGGNGAGAGGSGTLAVESGATVTAASITVYNPGILVLGANAQMNGPLTFLGGAIQASANLTFPKSFTLSTGGVHIRTNFFDATFSGTIDGAGALDKSGGFTTGPGTLTLTASNTYSGGTTISAGRLLANNFGATGSGPVTVSSGAILGGSGGVSGPVTINANGTLLGGNGSAANGTLFISNNVTLASGAKAKLALGSSGSHSTIARSAGAWSFPANLAFNFINAGAAVGIYDNIISGLAGDPGTEGTWTISTAGFSGTFVYDGAGNIDFNLTAVPAPPPPPPPGPNCSWNSATPYPIPILDNGAATVGTVLYSFGGVSNELQVNNAYKFDGVTWSPIAPVPAALEGTGVVSDGTSIYLVGGFDGNSYRNLLYRYNPASNTYTTLAPSSEATGFSAVVFLNGKIYKIGGFGSAATNVVEVYNVAANTWSAGASYPLSLSFLAAFAQNGFVYAAGGRDNDGNPSAKTYRYDPGTTSWSDAAIADLPVARWGSACARYNGAPVLAGGYVGSSTANSIGTSVLRWDAPTNAWMSLADMPLPRTRAPAAVLGASFYVLGGRSTTDLFTGSTHDQKLTCDPITFIVTTADDHNDGVCNAADCTLREAITVANTTAADSMRIEFLPSVTGQIQLAAALPNIASNTSLEGPGANLLTVRRNSGGNYRIFTVSSGAVASISDLTIANGNTPAQSGGGINNAGSLTLSRIALTGNVANASGNGGGLFNNFGTVLITDSTISGNSVSSNPGAGSGGGIFNSGGTITIRNSTLSGNTAIGPGGNSDSGGAMFNNAGIVTVVNSTIAANSGDLGGGIRNLNGGTIHVANTIMALNTSPSGPDLNGVFISDGHNLIGNASGGSGFTNGVNNDFVGVADPKLDPVLGNNGGPTSIHSLLSGSLALDSGNDALAPPRDQRGYSRVGPSDIGAVEFASTAPAPLQLLSAVSTKTHGAAGPFDIDLPLSGNPGIECRTGGANGNHTIVFTFTNPLTSAGTPTITSGTGSISSGGIGSDPHQYIVNLTGVTNAQRLTVTLINLADSLGNRSAVATTIGLLVGDSNGDALVNSGDAIQTRNRSGQPADATNFRSDYNVDGTINSGDAITVRNRSGTSLP